MLAAYTVNDDRLNIEVWPPTNPAPPAIRRRGGALLTPPAHIYGCFFNFLSV